MRVLVVEDDRSEAMTIQRVVDSFGHEVAWASSAAQAWDLLRDGDFRVVISDWMMPGGDGLSLCRRIRSAGLPFYAYVVILTGRHERQDLLEALTAGADDFLVKPIDPDQMRVRLLVAERIVGLERRLNEANEALRQYAADLDQRSKIDELMRIGNRMAFEARLRELHCWARGAGRVFGVVMCDVDRFKSYNDSLGHQRGDEILREVAKAVTNGVRSTDQAFRYGGEEIALLLPDLDVAEAARVAERVRRLVSSLRFEAPGARESFTVTISCGVAAFPRDARGEDDCLGPLEKADQALYQAKRRGRNRVVRADELRGPADWARTTSDRQASAGAPDPASPIQ
jgi:two-component system chemotaxis response regulator CheY